MNRLKKNNTPGPIGPKFFYRIKLLRKGIPQYDSELLKKYGKVVGTSILGKNMVLTCDPKFVKAVMIKDFSKFVNRNV